MNDNYLFVGKILEKKSFDLGDIIKEDYLIFFLKYDYVETQVKFNLILK